MRVPLLDSLGRDDDLAHVEPLERDGVQQCRPLDGELGPHRLWQAAVVQHQLRLWRSPLTVFYPTAEHRPVDLGQLEPALDLGELRFRAEPFEKTLTRILVGV